MDDPAFEVGHAGPLRDEPLGMPVIALAHPQKTARHVERLAAGAALALDAPALCPAIPVGALHLDGVAEMRAQPVVGDRFAQIVKDLGATGDGRAIPGLEVEAIGEKIAVRSHPRVAMQAPGAAVACHGVDDNETPLGSAAEGVGRSDAGNAGANHQNVDMLDDVRCRYVIAHRCPLFPA